MHAKLDLHQMQKIRMMDRFYSLFIWFCVVMLGLGVPFVFHRKLITAVLIGLLLVGILSARRLSRNGHPERSMVLFSCMILALLVSLIYGGLPANGAGVALATCVMLAVVVNIRAGTVFIAAYMLMWLLYIVLQQFQLAPPPFFSSDPRVAWLLVFGSIWLVLIPIPEMMRMLSQGASRQRSVLEATTDAILVVDLKGAVESYNQKFVSLWGIPKELIDQKNDAALLNYVVSKIAKPQEFIQRVNALYAHPEESSFDTFELTNNQVIERFSHANYVEDKVVGRVWSFRDVTASRRVQNELQSSQSKLQSLFDLSPLGMARNGMDGRFFEVNPAFIRMLGHGIEDLNAMSYWQITPEDYAEQEAVQLESLHNTGMYGPYEKEYIHKDGHRFPVRLNGIEIKDAQGDSYIWSIIEDITEQKAHESRLTAARMVAEEASQAKGQFLANMSHEIRTPMNAILGMLDLLQSTELTARQHDYASKTEVSARSLLGLLNDILDFSKVEAGKMTLESESFTIEHLLRNLSVVLSANVGSKDIEVLFDIDPTLPEAVRGDAMRLQQVLVNLGGNAVKFTSQGQVVVALRALSTTADLVTVEFAVQDTGIGIAPEHQSHIFSGFAQAEGSTTRRFGGTGLGLAISQRLVEMMGGVIHISSVVGIGSTFSFTLKFPVIKEIAANVMSVGATTLPPEKVLVVDDNQVAGALTQGMLRALGWSVDLAHSGAQALDLIQAQPSGLSATCPYSVIYIDWKMPSMDGWETTRRIRNITKNAQTPEPTIIMVAANGREVLAHRSESEQEQLNGFLTKPLTAGMLRDALKDARDGSPGLRRLTGGRSSKRQLEGMRILVVEDNLINQQVADELLSSEGAIVSLAANGKIGVDAVAAAAPQFDVVLMDVQMPVLDGYGATRSIRADLGLAQLPIIAMTANAMASDRDACIAAGMNEHVGKPFDFAKLVSLLIRMTGFQTDLCTVPDLPAKVATVPEVPGLDLVTALGRMSGMHSLYVRTAKNFSESLDSIVLELRQYMAAGERQSALMRLHTLKGNAGTLGVTDLAAKAMELEKMCKTGAELMECATGLDQLNALIQTTQDRLRQAIALLTPSLAIPISSGHAPINMAGVLLALRELDSLACAFDMAVLSRFLELRGAIENLPNGFADRLDNALQNLELHAAHELCAAMIHRLNGESESASVPS